MEAIRTVFVGAVAATSLLISACGETTKSDDMAAPSNPAASEPAAGLQEVPADFDGDVYLALYPDLVEGGVDPVTHYKNNGYREGRVYKVNYDLLPADFDSEEYVRLNPDAGSSPLTAEEHYLTYGLRDGLAYQGDDELEDNAIEDSDMDAVEMDTELDVDDEQ